MRRRAAARPSPRAQATRLTLVLVLLAGAGCTSPAAVKRYSVAAALVTARLPDASAALGASCRRTQSYRLRRASTAWYSGDSVAAACAGRDSALRDVGRANRALAAYFAALGRLAGAKAGEMDATLSALGDAAAEAGHFGKPQGDAVTALATFAAARAAHGYRRAKLREAVGEQNANVQIVISVLHDILDRDFARYLRDDETALTAFYRAALAESGTREPLAAILVRDSYDERQEELTRRVEAVGALDRALLVAGRGHQRLYDARDQLGAKELLGSIVSTARELDIAIAKIDKAF